MKETLFLDEEKDVLNDLISEIGITETYADCIDIVLSEYDQIRGEDDEALLHINRMKAMLDGLGGHLARIAQYASKAWDIIVTKPLAATKSKE